MTTLARLLRRARLRNGRALYSQGAEELLVRRFFGDRRGGVFADVGAGDWRTGSTTYYLEEHLGWSGIAVDARAELAEGYRLNRPRTRFFNYIVTDHSGTEDTLYLAGWLSSTKKAHLAAYDRIDAERAPVAAVPAITLTDLLDRSGIDRLDFLSMDIEQGEPEALAGFAIERFRPALVCVEVGTVAMAREIAGYFAGTRYTQIRRYLAHDTTNWYYRRHSCRPRRLDSCQAPPEPRD